MGTSKKKQDVGLRLERNTLSRDKILKAARSGISKDGTLPSLRALAISLGSSPMAIYRHFPNKDSLLLQLLDQVLGEVPLEQTKKAWRSQLKDFAYAHREVLVANPWTMPLLFSNPSPGANSSQIGEYVFGLLSKGNIRGEKAVAVFSGIIALNYGWASFESKKPRNFDLRFASQIQNLTLEDGISLPITQKLTPHLANFGSDRHYEITLNLIISNI